MRNLSRLVWWPSQPFQIAQSQRQKKDERCLSCTHRHSFLRCFMSGSAVQFRNGAISRACCREKIVATDRTIFIFHPHLHHSRVAASKYHLQESRDCSRVIRVIVLDHLAITPTERYMDNPTNQPINQSTAAARRVSFHYHYCPSPAQPTNQLPNSLPSPTLSLPLLQRRQQLQWIHQRTHHAPTSRFLVGTSVSHGYTIRTVNLFWISFLL